MKILHRVPAFALTMAAAGMLARADVTLPALFADHMVLQRAGKVPIWGWAAIDEKVNVQIAGQTTTTVADHMGRWKTSLDLQNVEKGPHALEVQGANRLVIRDVLIGEVWLCSGQSNMGLLLQGSVNDKEEIAISANDQLREFHVDKKPSIKPELRVSGAWRSAGPSTSGSFSAVAYYFGKTLQQTLGEPVGLIHVSYGGTPIETWMSLESLEKDSELGPSAQKHLENLERYPSEKQRFVTQFREWTQRYGRTDPSHPATAMFAAPDANTTGWREVTLPGTVPGTTAGGALWLRKEIDISAAWAGKSWPLYAGIPQQLEEIYWNGQKIGEMNLEKWRGRDMPRSYDVPAALVREGKNVLALRVYAPFGPISVLGSPNELRLSTIRSLAGSWLAKMEYELPPVPAEATASLPLAPAMVPEPQYVATTLFNGSIHPLLPYALRGIIWYQGESNTPRAWQYRTALPLLIEDWRQKWDDPQLSFLYCQIANVQEKPARPAESATAELRESQHMARTIPHTAEIVLIDQGEVDVHFRDKSETGARLARAALGLTYGKDKPYSGPVYSRMEKLPGSIRLHFTHTDGGLIARPLPERYIIRSKTGDTKPLVPPRPGCELQGFAICGEDHKWLWADARIDGNSVVVSSPEVPDPIAVRYGWSENPTCNLYNGAGLPASPFRTDNFPAITRSFRY